MFYSLDLRTAINRGMIVQYTIVLAGYKRPSPEQLAAGFSLRLCGGGLARRASLYG